MLIRIIWIHDSLKEIEIASKFIEEDLLQVYTHICTHTHTYSLCLLGWLLPQAQFIHVRDKILLCLIYLAQREWFFEIHCLGFWLWFYVKRVWIFTSALLVHYSRAQALTSTRWCGRWRHSHKKIGKDLESRGRYTGRMSIFLTWVLFLHHKAMSFPNQPWTNSPISKDKEGHAKHASLFKWAIIGTS